jgi:hypothetical protein
MMEPQLFIFDINEAIEHHPLAKEIISTINRYADTHGLKMTRALVALRLARDFSVQLSRLSHEEASVFEHAVDFAMGLEKENPQEVADA